MSKPIDYLSANASAVLPARRLSIYFASKLRHAAVGRKLSADWPEFDWTARWPTAHVGKVPDQSNFARIFWQHDLEDVAGSDVVMCYALEGDHLRGALVEVGMGLALGKAVLVIGDHPDYGTWQWHPLVHRAETLAEARVLLRALAL